ncbi:hypothetical protein TNCV_3354981 [Trichonephila clavipes]|nr:hypothetical protein TNCV_3354981 [Trichonephila clavipes]
MDKCVQMLVKNYGALGQTRALDRQNLREEPCPGSRELEEIAKEGDLVRDWSVKEGKTMNAPGGVGELE